MSGEMLVHVKIIKNPVVISLNRTRNQCFVSILNQKCRIATPSGVKVCFKRARRYDHKEHLFIYHKIIRTNIWWLPLSATTRVAYLLAISDSRVPKSNLLPLQCNMGPNDHVCKQRDAVHMTINLIMVWVSLILSNQELVPAKHLSRRYFFIDRVTFRWTFPTNISTPWFRKWSILFQIMSSEYSMDHQHFIIRPI